MVMVLNAPLVCSEGVEGISPPVDLWKIATELWQTNPSADGIRPYMEFFFLPSYISWIVDNV